MKFTIKKGSHYSNKLWYKSLNIINNSRFVRYSVYFHESCRYEINSEDQSDINKLFGYSLGFNHHNDSARFGWNYYDEKLNLYAYVYDKGLRKSKFITTIEIGKPYHLTIIDQEYNWLFTVDNTWSVISNLTIQKSSKFNIGYKLWPYFGGNVTSPQDISIELSRIF